MKPRHPSCSTTLTIVLAVLGIAWNATAVTEGPYTCTLTDTWYNVYGDASVDGAPVAAGDEVAAFDPDGVCCGVSRVTMAGRYGFMCVYGNDPDTPEDEGAEAGDAITFRIWRNTEGRVYVASESLSSWEDKGQTRVDLTADGALPVELSTFVALSGEDEIILRWVTEGEADTLRFHVYRARTEEGPSTRLTGDPVQGRETSAHGAAYVYADQDLHNRAVYYYWIEGIAFDGPREMHGPVMVRFPLCTMSPTWGSIKRRMAPSEGGD